MNQTTTTYVGFWARVGAALIDTILLLIIIGPLLYAFYGAAYFTDPTRGMVSGIPDLLISWVFPIACVIAFWIKKQATPGKMVVSARIVDASTGQAITPKQAVIRYLGYFVSTIPLLLGFIWVAFDARKQGWHDKIAGTVVIRG
jgi:uncharacterized RDD family membrane protein YckC